MPLTPDIRQHPAFGNYRIKKLQNGPNIHGPCMVLHTIHFHSVAPLLSSCNDLSYLSYHCQPNAVTALQVK